MPETNSLLSANAIEQRIPLIRGEKVLLDSDLAELHDVETKVLNPAIQRHKDRFPEDFTFRLTPAEFAVLRSHSVLLRRDFLFSCEDFFDNANDFNFVA